ncbi:MAG: DUF808 family protein, partial [Paracoccaceae bacterium]
KVAGAIKTDFILSAEIMTIALAAIPQGTLLVEAVTLAVVGVAITVAVYGAVALIVKMDDVGLHMATTGRTGAGRGIGRGLVAFMPKLLAALSLVGTLAMLWVGGSIVIHGMEGLGLGWLGHHIHDWAALAGHRVPQATAAVEWIAKAVMDGIFGLALGMGLIPVATGLILPVWSAVTGRKPTH